MAEAQVMEGPPPPTRPLPAPSPDSCPAAPQGLLQVAPQSEA